MRKIFYMLIAIYITLGGLAQAAMLVPDIYISAGYNMGTSEIKYYNDVTSISKDAYSTNTNNYQFALGIRPLDIPILGGFRVEAEYGLPASSNIKDKDLGVVLFYDFRLLPIVTPYIGVGYHNNKYTFNNIEGLGTSSDTNNSYSFHGGADFAIPIVGLNIFLDYKYQQTSTRATNKDTSKYGIKDQSVTVGLKYYIIS